MQRCAAFAKRTPVVREREEGDRLRGVVVGAEPEIFGRLIRIDDLVRIHPVARIPDRLELGKRAHELRAEHLRQQCAARLTVAMFSGKRTAVPNHQVGPAIDELGVLPDAVFRLEIEADLHVDAAMAEMPVERRLIFVLVQQLAKVAQVRPEAFRCNRCVVPSFPPRKRSRYCRSGARTRLANLPDRLGLCRGVDSCARSVGRARQHFDQPVG